MIHTVCPQEYRHPVPGRPDLTEVRCPHFLYPLRYDHAIGDGR